MKINENQLKSIKINQYQSKSIKINQNQLKSINVYRGVMKRFCPCGAEKRVVPAPRLTLKPRDSGDTEPASLKNKNIETWLMGVAMISTVSHCVPLFLFISLLPTQNDKT